MSIIIQNIISIPYESNESYHQTQNDYNLTSLQYEVMITIEKIHQQIVTNLNSNSNLLPLIFYQYLALSLYAVNIGSFISFFYFKIILDLKILFL